MKAFADMLTQQVRDILDEKNVRLGITLDDIKDVRSGEICFAGVLMDDNANNRGHGVVILADVRGNEAKAEALLEKIALEMKDLGGVKEPIDPIQGVAVTKWKVPQVRDPNLKFDTFQTICDGWLIATDNYSVLFNILLRIKQPAENQAIRRLIDDPTFLAIQQRINVEAAEPEIRWFVEPFGYIELAQKIAKQENLLKKREDDHAQKLRENGFDALRGVGGLVAVNKHDFDVFYRVFAYTAADQVQGATRKRALEIFDFRNLNQDPLLPPDFIPANYVSHFGMTWDMGKAYDNVGPIVDIFFGKDFFQQLENSFINDSKVNMRELVGRLANRLEIVSAVRKPIDPNSERVAILIPVNGTDDELKKLFRDIKRLSHNSELKSERGLEYLEINSEEDESEDELQIDIINRFGDDNETVDAEEEEDGHTPYLFAKKFIAVVNRNLVVSNNADVLFELRDHQPSQKFQDAEDFLRVQTAVGKFVNWEIVSARQFGRLDQQLETNYEMFRQGNMGASQTVLARILNEAFRVEGQDDKKPRVQKMDATTLPSDYAGLVAPYLGYTGMALETHPDGWLLTGGILKKKSVSEAKSDVVQKPESVERR
jgi:hypothetical protein